MTIDLGVDDEAALPVTVRPRVGESLAGLALCTDEANGWPADTIARLVSRVPTGGAIGFGRPGLYVIATSFDLVRLAALLGVDHQEVAATTLVTPLRRIFGSDAGARRLGRTGPFRVCPECIRESRFVGIETMLPLMTACVVHHVAFVSACSCGRPLGAYAPEREPFVCADCWRDWGTLPTTPTDPRQDLQQRQILHAYQILFERGTDEIFPALKSLVPSVIARRWEGGMSRLDGPVEDFVIPRSSVNTLTSIVAGLVVSAIPPERLFETIERFRDLRCLNRACPTYGQPDRVRANGHRKGQVESYCAECGSRFLGDRIISTFDHDHGDPHLRDGTVMEARARLRGFLALTAAACDYLAAQGRPVKVREALELAAVPRAGYLRARRVGLVALIHQRLGKLVIEEPDEPAYDGSTRWIDPRAKATVEAHAARIAG